MRRRRCRKMALCRDEFGDGFVEAFFFQELQLRGAFAAGEDQAVAALEIGGRADLDGFHAETRRACGRAPRSRLGLRGFRFSILLQSERNIPVDRSQNRRKTGRPNIGSIVASWGGSKPRPYKIAPSRMMLARRWVVYQPRVESRSFCSIWRTSRPGMASPSSSLASSTAIGSSKCVVAFTTALARASGSLDLKIPDPTKTASAPSLRTSAASAGVAMPPAEKFGTGSLPVLATVTNQIERRAEFFRLAHQFVVAHAW